MEEEEEESEKRSFTAVHTDILKLDIIIWTTVPYIAVPYIMLYKLILELIYSNAQCSKHDCCHNFFFSISSFFFF